LKAGLFVNVRLRVGVRSKVVLLPDCALVEEAGQKFVFVAKGHEYEKREVTVGAAAHGRVEIRHGVQAGEPVVIEGQHELKAPPKAGGGEEEVEVD
jgi:multidrug efflux pump subunit AcrA (membrane-fusion protein)